MPGGSALITIIVLIAVVWQIISVIVAHAQQQKQRQAEAQARRQRAAGGGGGAAKSQNAGASPLSGEKQPERSKLDELAARRQQQLEELRQRHATGRQAAPAGAQSRSDSPSTKSQWESSTQLRTGQTSVELPTDVDPRSAPTTKPSRRSSPGRSQQKLQEQQRTARRQQEEMQRQQRERRQQQQARPDRRIEPQVDPQAIGEVSPAPSTAVRDAYMLVAPSPPDQPVHSERVHQLLHNRATLREMIVMKEVLDVPVSLREPRFA